MVAQGGQFKTTDKNSKQSDYVLTSQSLYLGNYMAQSLKFFMVIRVSTSFQEGGSFFGTLVTYVWPF